ncbi:MAG: serine/threonine protein kinase [Chloroflexi bacterium]|jgi:hypothetical protein|nr:serine/threonine protein kinase [Chloroflexota bacterium]
MIKLNEQESSRIISRIKEISGIIPKSPIEVVTDTTQFTRIYQHQVIRLQGRDFFVRGDVYEPRFGMQDQPKFWVKRGHNLESGRMVIIKLEFHEEFTSNLGTVQVPCFRRPQKEADVMELVKGDRRFMQGETLFDDVGNCVRVIDYINGTTLYGKIYDMTIDHEEYYYTELSSILKKVAGCFEAIEMLHEHKLYHGDIRNDHILIDEQTGEYRWIDFDLCQNFEAFDVWRLGNVLQFVVGKGLNPLDQILRFGDFPDGVVESLGPADCGAYYTYRLMNLRKIYPYISENLNDILMRFSAGSEKRIRILSELVGDLYEAILTLPKDPLDQPLA